MKLSLFVIFSHHNEPFTCTYSDIRMHLTLILSSSLHEQQLSAQEEEARILKQQKEKEAKLQHFQDEVRKRVRQLQHIKQQQQMQKSRSAV